MQKLIKIIRNNRKTLRQSCKKKNIEQQKIKKIVKNVQNKIILFLKTQN